MEFFALIGVVFDLLCGIGQIVFFLVDLLGTFGPDETHRGR